MNAIYLHREDGSVNSWWGNIYTELIKPWHGKPSHERGKVCSPFNEELERHRCKLILSQRPSADLVSTETTVIKGFQFESAEDLTMFLLRWA